MRERELLADALNRLIEAEPGLDADDQQVERVGQPEADAVLPALGQAAEHHARQQVAERRSRRAPATRFGRTTIGEREQREHRAARSRARMPKKTASASWLR